MAEHDETDPDAPSYYDLQAIEQRQQELMGKRHGTEGLSPEEFDELLVVNQQALDMRARWDSQR